MIDRPSNMSMPLERYFASTFLHHHPSTQDKCSTNTIQHQGVIQVTNPSSFFVQKIKGIYNHAANFLTYEAWFLFANKFNALPASTNPH